MVNKESFQKVIDFLENLDPKCFFMDYFDLVVTRHENGKIKTACALGWMPVIFPEEMDESKKINIQKIRNILGVDQTELCKLGVYPKNSMQELYSASMKILLGFDNSKDSVFTIEDDPKKMAAWWKYFLNQKLSESETVIV